jgi:hypothetical protein
MQACPHRNISVTQHLSNTVAAKAIKYCGHYTYAKFGIQRRHYFYIRVLAKDGKQSSMVSFFDTAYYINARPLYPLQ